MNRNARSRETDAEWIVGEPTELLLFLQEVMPSKSRNTVKAILSRGQVVVNNKASTQFNDLLKEGDHVRIHTRVADEEVKMKGVSILFEDDDLIVIDKAAGLLSVATKKERDATAYRQLTDYVKSIHNQNRIFVVHRLDRDTSGVMMFAKNKETQQKLQLNWEETMSERSYVALVEGSVKQGDTITSWLKENKAYHVYSSNRPDDGQKAITHYKVRNSSRNLSLLDVQLETGRKNQIRVHMQDIGHPVVGDKKYGATNTSIGRLGLHANAIAFTHPTTGKPVRFESKVPSLFTRSFN